MIIDVDGLASMFSKESSSRFSVTSDVCDGLRKSFLRCTLTPETSQSASEIILRANALFASPFVLAGFGALLLIFPLSGDGFSWNFLFKLL